MKADLHLHTNFSFDGFSSPEEIVEAAIAKKIDCICICDHEEVEGAAKAIEYAQSKPVLVIPGIEIKSKSGDILGLNVEKIIPNQLSAKETILEILKEGGLPVIAHPFDWAFHFKEIERYKDFFKEKQVGIEVLNACLFLNSSNDRALKFAKESNLFFTAGSDAHSSFFVGKAYLEIPGENLTKKEVLEAIKAKNVKVRFEQVGFFEKALDHIKRNIAKVINKL